MSRLSQLHDQWQRKVESRDAAREESRKLDAELHRLRARLSAECPDGFEFTLWRWWGLIPWRFTFHRVSTPMGHELFRGANWSRLKPRREVEVLRWLFEEER